MNLSIRTKAALLALGLLALNSSTASAQQVLKPGLPAQPVLTPRLPIRPPSTPSPEERHRQRIERARQTAIMAVNMTAPGPRGGYMISYTLIEWNQFTITPVRPRQQQVFATRAQAVNTINRLAAWGLLIVNVTPH